MSTNPLVSVIVPTYNRTDEILDTIDTIESQTFCDFEVVVVNDGGDSVSELVLSRNYLSNIRIYDKKNGGVASALNYGIERSRGKMITFLGDDDYLDPDHLESLIDFKKAQKARAVYSNATRIRKVKNGNRYVEVSRNEFIAPDFDMDRLLWENYIFPIAILVDLDVIVQAGMHDENLKTHEDWDLNIKIAQISPFSHLNRSTVSYSWRDDGKSLTSSKREDFLKTMKIIHEKYIHLAHDSKKVLHMQNRAQIALKRELRGGLWYQLRNWLFWHVKKPVMDILKRS
jgi:O-antigen biosynthesis protein